MFKKLSKKAEENFRAWARENYLPYTPILGVWHPVIQAECVRINYEADRYYSERLKK